VRLGVTPAAPGTLAFDRAIAASEVKWAGMKNLGLRVMPAEVAGEELFHPVLSGGEDVLAAGTSRIETSGSGYYGRYITNVSGHFQPSEESLQIGISAFSDIGVDFNEVRQW
jgi:hypothetical protein